MISTWARGIMRDRAGVAVVVTGVLGTAAVGLSRDLVTVALWTVMWGLAGLAVWPEWRRLPFYLWLAAGFFYPQASDRFSSANEFATISSALLLVVGLTAIGSGAFVLRWQRMTAAVFALWVVWGLVVYVPVFVGWALRAAGVSQVLLPGIFIESSALKTAGPVLLAWTPAIGALAVIRTPDGARRFFTWLMIATLVFAALSLAQLAVSGYQGFWVPVTYSILPSRLHSISSPDANSTARQMLPALVLLLAVAVMGRRATRPWLLWPALLAAAVVMLMTVSRTAVLSASAAVVVVVLAEIRRRRTALVAGSLFVVVILALAGLALSGAIGADRLSLGSLAGRVELYEVVWRVISAHPIIGVRPGGYADALAAAGHPDLISPHNMWFGVAAEWGIPMAIWLTAALVMTWALGLDGLYRLRRLPRVADGWREARILLVGAVALATTWTVHGLSEIVPPDSVFFALGLALAARCRLVPAVSSASGGAS